MSRRLDGGSQRAEASAPPEPKRALSATTPASGLSAAELQQAARDHLWLHFTRMAGYQTGDVPIIVRGEGCYLEDVNGKRYLDALAGLFAVQLGYSYGDEIGQAAHEQMRELPFYTNWSYAHPRAIELAKEVAGLAPGDLNRVFFVSGGSEAVESAWKLARQYFTARGERRWKAVARNVAYHGTTMGALSINGIPTLRAPFEPLVPGVAHCRNTARYHRPEGETDAELTAFLLDDLQQTIEAAGPEQVALVIMEPVQNAGGALTPPDGYFAGVRAICDEYGILLCADEVITGFGRLGHWFGSERYDIRPDIVTCAKGLSSAYASIGAVIVRDSVMEPFLAETAMFSHGITFGGHPVASAIALKNLEIMQREGVVENVRANEQRFRETLAQLLELPIAGDLRGAGYFWALELVKDKETKETFSDEECETLLRGFLSPRLFEQGLICRADDRGDPVVQISPPLVAGQAEFDQIAGILGDVLAEAWERVPRAGGPPPAPGALRARPAGDRGRAPAA
jgi:adenosylmethionine-8-amino-7-oxononanoate aminotransferase